ncbi:hypothetical protein GCM10023196_022340 [Actinoallomurus vinaceus]|uniref:Uncharacterized protein n=1 Tax=Actinoallomurus vinaceus TaxID=1080074 RepID=A0ABP8U9S7_9ACTN
MRRITASRGLALLGLGISLPFAASMNIDAEAALIPQRVLTAAPAGDNNHVANGRHNASSVTIRSPSFFRGIQLVGDANVRALTNTNNAFCKKRRHCKIRQRAVIIAH